MVEKRPHGDDTELQNGNKRPRSNNGSPAPASNGLPRGAFDIQQKIAEAKKRAELVKARLAAQRGTSGSPASTTAQAAPVRPPNDDTAAKIEDAKRRVAELRARTTATKTSAVSASSKRHDESSPQMMGGLAIGLHPSLFGQDKADAKPDLSQKPNLGRKQGKQEQSPALEDRDGNHTPVNPYLVDSGEAPIRARPSRQLQFNEKGKFIAQAAALRRQAQLEEVKRKIAEKAKKVENDVEKAFTIPEPPEIEWWDEGLIGEKEYGDLDAPGRIKMEGEETIISILVQHPVLIEPPQEKNMPAPKPMFLTKTEQAKLRRQRRMADLKEHQAKIRLGLEPPPPPKVKKSNLMRVLGEEAVKDPTAVEARVNREIADRAATHERMNEDRKLSKEQRHEKLAKQQEGDAAKGIRIAVYKVNTLAYGKHRFQIDINAKEWALTGVCIMNPVMSLIIVEGGAHSQAAYKKLMLRRIRWTENVLPANVDETKQREEVPWLSQLDENGDLKDLSNNKCILVWEGEERQRSFKTWRGMKACETEAEAKDMLSRTKTDNMWTLAKNMSGEV